MKLPKTSFWVEKRTMILRNADYTWKERVFKLYLTELDIAEGGKESYIMYVRIAPPLAEKSNMRFPQCILFTEYPVDLCKVVNPSD